MLINWESISEKTLASINLDDMLSCIEPFECSAYQTEVARQERDEARWSVEQHECLRFIGAVLSMTLRSDQPTEPFMPVFVMGELRSPIPADFPRERVRNLEEWMMSLRTPELRARFLDLLWIQARSYKGAQVAVEAYIESALRLEHPEKWSPSHKRLERALRLSAGLGNGGKELRARVLGAIEDMLIRHRGTDTQYLSLRLTRLLLEFKHGDTRQFAEFAQVAALSAEKVQNFWRAKDYYQLAAECYRLAGDAEMEVTALRKAAESLVNEAELAYAQPARGAVTAASILSDAVEAMRQVAGGRERAAELHA